MQKFLFQLSIVVLLISCARSSKPEKELGEVLNTPLDIMMFDLVLHKDTLFPFLNLRGNYDFLSVVYLQDGCQPCYPKFVEWHQKMDEMGELPGHTLLFVIQTDDYEAFLNKVNELDLHINKKYYIIIDPSLQFVIKNSRIPAWILNSSMLIDRENKIKMVGAPWINEDMKNLFYKIVSNEQQTMSSKQLSINNVH